MTTLVLVTDEKEIIECQDNLENVLKSQLNQEEEFSFGFQGGNFSNAANHNNSLWYSTFVDDKAKIPRFWNGFGLCENLNGNNAHISLEINIPKNASRQVNGAFVKDNGNVALIPHIERLTIPKIMI
jgi:hypothetical protein